MGFIVIALNNVHFSLMSHLMQTSLNKVCTQERHDCL